MFLGTYSPPHFLAFLYDLIEKLKVELQTNNYVTGLGTAAQSFDLVKIGTDLLTLKSNLTLANNKANFENAAKWLCQAQNSVSDADITDLFDLLKNLDTNTKLYLS